MASLRLAAQRRDSPDSGLILGVAGGPRPMVPNRRAAIFRRAEPAGEASPEWQAMLEADREANAQLRLAILARDTTNGKVAAWEAQVRGIAEQRAMMPAITATLEG